MVILEIRVDDDSPLANMRRELARIKREVMGGIAEEFIRTHVAPHFGPSNRSRYGHEPRNQKYQTRIKVKRGQGQGKYVDDILSGVSKRQVQNSIRYTKTQDKAVVYAKVPAYFAKPFKGTYYEEKTRRDGSTYRVQKQIQHQPDKVKELTTVDKRDRDELAEYGAKLGAKLWKRSPRRTVTLRG